MNNKGLEKSLEKIKCIRCRNIHFMLFWTWQLINERDWYFDYDCSCSEYGRRVIFEVSKNKLNTKNNMARQLTNEELKRIREIGQDEALARESKGEQKKLEPIRKIKNVKFGWTGKRQPCSGCVEKHGVRYNVNQDIHLTFSRYHGEQGEAIENYCLDCAREMWENWDEIMTNDLLARQKFNLEKVLKK